MNVTYVALGAVFFALAAGLFARARKAGDESAARKSRTPAILLMVAGIMMIATGLIVGD